MNSHEPSQICLLAAPRPFQQTRIIRRILIHMQIPIKIWTKSALLVCTLTAAIAMPTWSDTLVLRSGATYSGTLTGVNGNWIIFKDQRGITRHYMVRDVDSVQFGDAPNQSSGGQPQYDPSHENDGNFGGNNNHQGGGNRDDQGRANYDNARDYDQGHMERVVLPAGSELAIMTNERIDSRDVVDGQTFAAQVNEDIRNSDGSIAIPRGSDANLITRRVEGNGDLTLDVQSITVGGRRYRVSTADQELENHRDGVGANKRTGQFMGGGAVFGAIIGAIAGGGKGAAIGAVAGAGAGAGAQIITQGKEVHVPAETVLRFKLDRPLALHLWQ
jgi:hypothetical protein